MLRLPEGWSEPEVVEDSIALDGLTVQRAGIASSFGDDEAFGAAASTTGQPRERAEFEFLERVAAVDARRKNAAMFPTFDLGGRTTGSLASSAVFPPNPDPAVWRHSTTNGVALHRDWRSACTRARYELAERDRALRSWSGEIGPVAMATDDTVVESVKSYVWRAVSFPDLDGDRFSAELAVCGVFGFPREGAQPFALGFAARPSIRDALTAAADEALQMLAFLWGEPVPEPPAIVAPTAMSHLDAFQTSERQRLLRAWLDGAHGAYAGTEARQRGHARVEYVDLTPDWLDGSLRVAKAICSDAFPLTFGLAPEFHHLPPELRIHPIP